jgi:hypothetical protein
MASKTYEYLKKIYNNEEVGYRWEYPDDLIYDVRGGKTPSSTQIIIAFDNDDDFLDILGIEDNEDKWVWRKFMGRGYYDGEVDTHDTEEDWDNGHIISEFNSEQIEKLSQILKITNPKLTLTDGDFSQVAKFLKSMFDSEVNDIIYDYAYEYEQCNRKGVITILEDETKNPFSRFGVVELQHGYKFKTTVGILLNWYKMLNAEDEDLKGLLTRLIEKYDNNASRGGWSELEYNDNCYDLDKDAIHKSFDKNLNEMLEAAEETFEYKQNYQEYINLLNIVNKLGGFDKWIDIQDGNKIRFHDIDRDTNTLRIVYSKKGDWKGEARSVNNVEDLNTMMYNLELFEHLSKMVQKIL